MKKCEFCDVGEATIHLTQVVDGTIKKLNLCQECAQRNGIDLHSPVSITDLLLGIGKQQAKRNARDQGDEFDLCCSRCQLSRAEFKKRARMGCPECYQSFHSEVSAITQAMHHSRQHVGKIPKRQGQEVRMSSRIASLKKGIEVAIEKEDYEQAARLRDEIRNIHKKIDQVQKGSANDT